MTIATVGGIWQNPERKQIFGGSEAFVYVIDGFTIAHVFAPGYVHREKVGQGFDLAIFLPTDPHRTTPHKWVREFDEAEAFIKQQREAHPEWPTEPVPLTVYVPRFKPDADARSLVVGIAEVLEAGDYDFHGESMWTSALLMLVHCEGKPVNQQTIDLAWDLRAVYNDLKD